MKTSLITITSLAALSITACSIMPARPTTSHPNYAFEQHPRSVLAQIGITPSTSPRLAVRVSGEIYLLGVFGKDGRLGFFMSHNGGDTFMGPIAISEPGARVTAHGEASPSLAVGPTQIYALWEQSRPHASADLMFARSLTWGHSFEKAVRVTDKTKPSFNGFASLGAAPNGNVYTVWLDGRDQTEVTGTFSVYLAKSPDQGASLGRNIRVATGACPCCRPSIAFGKNGEVFVAWRKVFPGDIRDMVVSTSRDGGQTFGAPVRVAADNWKLNGCPDSGPTIVESDGQSYVAWLTEGTEDKARLRLAWSDDGANSFKPAVNLPGGVLDPNHPVFARGVGGTVLLLFQGRDGSHGESWSPIQAYLTEIRGTEMSQPRPVPNDQKSVSYPTFGIGTAGRLFIAWTEPGQQGSNIVLCRSRRVS